MAKQSEFLNHIRHSLAHILAMAVLEKFPKTQLGIGPVIENGFYYDFLIVDERGQARGFTPDDLKAIGQRMKDLVRMELGFTGHKITPMKAKALFKNQPFKLDLIKDFIKDNKPLTAYVTHPPKPYTLNAKPSFTDLCRGGHVKNTEEIDPEAFVLDKVAGAYWRGDENNPQLTRIYGLAFESKKELDDYLGVREEAEKRDHKKLGPQLDLFTFSELVGSGLPLWTPKGTLLRNLLDDFVWQLRKKVGYEQVDIPHITKKELYERSGHWDKFKDELFIVKTREGHEFVMKPMNCPHHTQIYARKQWSYRELPQRYANTTKVYRDEQSGELTGLSRVRAFTQDDAHVFCRASQVEEEIIKIWNIIETFYGAFGLGKLRVRLSLHDPKHPEEYLGSPAVWKKAESNLRDIAKTKGEKTEEAEGEAAFYGPKIDFLAKDSLGREWQVATIQLDMNQPERFDLFCINEKSEKERIVMIHAAIMGSIERFLAILIEHYAGAFPLWLAPEQVRILPISEKFTDYAKKVEGTLREKDIRVTISEANETLGKRIREAQLIKIPYVLVVGEKEMTQETVSVRHVSRGDEGVISIQDFETKAQDEIRKKS